MNQDQEGFQLIRQKLFEIQAGTDFTSFSTGIKIKVFRENAECREHS